VNVLALPLTLPLPSLAVAPQADQPFAELQAEARRILASEHFRKAERSKRLLVFLVEQAVRGVAGGANEYAIGIAVFQRNAALYSTGEDPIVRVHMGRLRSRLAEYYLGEGRKGSGCRIDIPVGSYVPRLLHRPPQPVRMLFQGLRCISNEQEIDAFTHGLGEELRYRLYRALGARLALPTPGRESAEQLRQLGVGFVLEGSVRQDAGTIRTTLRLVCLDEARTLWSEQLDHADDISLRRQETLAEACCEALNILLNPM
jgi:TolB-like protein